MMIWWTAYLASCIVVPPLFIGFWIQHNGDFKHEITHGDTGFGHIVFSLFWPLVIGELILMNIIKRHKESIVKRAKDIVMYNGLDFVTGHDRTRLVEVKENDLKFLLKHYRSKKIKLDQKLFEMIREELMNRNAERSLLQ